MHPLDGCRWKVARAKGLLEEIDGEIATFSSRKAYGVTGKFEPETSEYVFYTLLFEPFPLNKIAVMVGEFIHSMSSALDHLAWQLVILNGQKPFERQTGFPIFESRTKYEGERGGEWMMAGMAERHVAEIERYQPYHAADPPREPLAVLRNLWNIDKHRAIYSTGNQALKGRARFLPVRDVGSYTASQVGPFSLEHGAEIARIRVEKTGPHPKVIMQGGVTSYIVFSEGPLAGQRVDEALSAIRQIVASIIYVIGMDFPAD